MAEPPIGGGPKPPIDAPPPANFCIAITAIIIIGFFAICDIMAIGFPPPIMAVIGLPNFGARCFPFASASLLVASEDAAITATASAAAANFLKIVMVVSHFSRRRHHCLRLLRSYGPHEPCDVTAITIQSIASEIRATGQGRQIGPQEIAAPRCPERREPGHRQSTLAVSRELRWRLLRLDLLALRQRGGRRGAYLPRL